MKTKIVVCPTMRWADYEWHRLVDKYRGKWVYCKRNPLSLTSVFGTKYIFYSYADEDKLIGYHEADIISVERVIDDLSVESEELRNDIRRDYC